MSSSSNSNIKDLVNGDDSCHDISFVICTICHEKYTESCDVRAGECGHVFHYSCLQQWRLESSNCPICRKNSPNQFKLFLDFEESNVSAKKKLTSKVTPKSATSASDEVDFIEYENLLYEARLYRKEIEYLTKRLEEQDELLVKKKLELENQAKRNTQMKCVFKQMQRSIMEKDTFELLVTDFINTMSELNLDDDNDSTDSSCNSNNTHNKNKNVDYLNYPHHAAGGATNDFGGDDYLQAMLLSHSHKQQKQ